MAQLSLTEQLQRYSAGDRDIAEAVLQEILPELHAIAVREVRRERSIVPVRATELLNEVWLKFQRGGWKIDSRSHFYSIAAMATRNLLIDFARNRLSQRRGNGDAPVPLEEAWHSPTPRSEDLETFVQMGLLMDRLFKKDIEAAAVVDLHYFVGYTFEEVTQKTGLTLRQVRHRWERGCNWLKDHL